MLRRFSRLLLASLLLLSLPTLPSYAQKGKVVSKIVQKAFKKTGKEVAKEGVEKAGKEAVIDATGKYVEKKAIKNAAKDISYHKVEKEVLKLEKKEVSGALRKGATKAASFASDAVRVSVEKNALHTLEKAEMQATGATVEKFFIKRNAREGGQIAISQELKKSADKKALSLSTSRKAVSEKSAKEAEEKALKISSKGKAQYFEKLIKRKASKFGMTEQQQKKLLNDILANDELAGLIRKNPDFNIARWMETMKSVDKTRLAKLANGKYPINYQYAGNTFYFHPALNKNVNAQLAKKGTYNGYTKEQLLELDRLFPNGVPFDEKGFPDFVKAGLCKKGPDGKDLIVTMPNGFTGNRDKDFEIVRKILADQGIQINEFGYIWHHLPGNPPRMALIKTEAHEIIKHTGGHSMAKAAL